VLAEGTVIGRIFKDNCGTGALANTRARERFLMGPASRSSAERLRHPRLVLLGYREGRRDAFVDRALSVRARKTLRGRRGRSLCSLTPR
jgi:hypothetical protein